MKLIATLSGTAVFSSAVSQHLTTTAGLAYDTQDTTAIRRLWNTVSFSAPSTTTAKGSASVAIESDVVGNFYGIAGSVTAITASLVATVDSAAIPKWKLTYAITAATTLDLRRSISDNTLSTAQLVLFSKVLAQAIGLPMPTATVTLTFGEYPTSTFITTAYQRLGVLFAGQGQTPYPAEDPRNPTSRPSPVAGPPPSAIRSTARSAIRTARRGRSAALRSTSGISPRQVRPRCWPTAAAVPCWPPCGRSRSG